MELLTAEQLRVLGALIEKEATTPDQYPLTMNGLLAACNQTSNRTPVVTWDAEVVAEILASLRQAGLVRVVHSASNRAEKYRHVAGEAWELGEGELAVLAVLALRGPQTVNELRTRTERYTGMEDMGGVEGLLHRLKNRYSEPWVTRLERRAGQREERWAHLLAGEPSALELDRDGLGDGERESDGNGSSDRPRLPTSARLGALEDQVAQMAEAIEKLGAEVADLRALLE